MAIQKSASVATIRNVVFEPLSNLVRSVTNTVFDRITHMETSKTVSYDELGVPVDEGHYYMPSTWFNLFMLQRLLRQLGITPNDVFIDFGSGKGRVLFVAARFPFGQVIGVELSAKLNQIARENIAKNRTRFVCPSIEIVTADAADYEIPDDVTVAYFANPFGRQVLSSVLDRLCASLEQHPRRFTLIYVIQEFHDEVVRHGFQVVQHQRNLTVYTYPARATRAQPATFSSTT